MAGTRTGQGPEVPNGIELHKDGTATLSIDNERWRLRRPKLGEFRKLRELLREREDNRLRLMTEVQADAGDKPGDEASAEDKLAFTISVSERSRRLSDGIQDLNIEWLGEALAMLCDREPPPVDDWPSGMEQSETVQQLVDHWREVPLRSGGG